MPSVKRITGPQFMTTALRFRGLAQERGKVELLGGGTLYFYGSELATLRLLKYWRTNELARADFSPNLNTHFFRLEVPASDGPRFVLQANDNKLETLS